MSDRRLLGIMFASIVILWASAYAAHSQAETVTVCGMWATDIDFVGGGQNVEYTASIWCGEFLNNDTNAVQPCAFVDYRGVTYPSHSGCQPVPEPSFAVTLLLGCLVLALPRSLYRRRSRAWGAIGA